MMIVSDISARVDHCVVRRVASIQLVCIDGLVLRGLLQAFLAVFMLEATLKIFAMPVQYWRESWNIFDVIVIAVSVVDIAVSQVRGLSIIRTFRLVSCARNSALGTSYIFIFNQRIITGESFISLTQSN